TCETSSPLRQPHVWLLTDHHHRERVWLDAALGPAPGCSRRRFKVLSRGKKYFPGFRIESHGPGTRLSLYCSGVFVFISGLFMKDTQDTFAAGKENQLRLRIKPRIVNAAADGHAGNYFPRNGIHHYHLRLIAASDEQTLGL